MNPEPKNGRNIWTAGATAKVQGELLEELIHEGHQAIPSQLIETDKKAHLKRPGFEHTHEPELKSRLVACGHLEDAKDIRADSPTCATEGFNLICSFAAGWRLQKICFRLKIFIYCVIAMFSLIFPNGWLVGWLVG